MKVAVACRLFGHCRQAYYQSKSDLDKERSRNSIVIENVLEIRREDPGIGSYKLWMMLIVLFGREKMMGRDCFYELLRFNHLMLPPPKPRHTTNSNHRYHKWKNLIRGFVPTGANQLWVSDITYISTSSGACYLHLITDAYSRKIIGWVLAETLQAAITMEALSQAIEQATAMRGSQNLKGLIHHSDRGVQYCCDSYVKLLRDHDISISMTEDYKPTDNAIAERINGIIKTECVYRCRQFDSPKQAREVIGRYIRFYNNRRPHMSLDYKTPATVHLEQGEQRKRWKHKVWTTKNTTHQEIGVSLPK